MKIRTILMLGWLLGLAGAAAQEKEAESKAVDPFADDTAQPLRLRVETWEAPALEVAKRLDDLHDAAGLAKLRAECLAGAAGVSLIFSPTMAIDSSTKKLDESITERIYPTEYEPPSLPGSFISAPDRQEMPKNWAEMVENVLTDCTPTSFETRNTGLTLEAEVTPLQGKEKTWNVRLALENVVLVGNDTFGAEALHLAMPAFNTFRLTGEARLKEGQWRLLSVMEPPRGIEGKLSGDRWVTLVRIDADR
ncbi:hypothetical protein OKA05_22740 [Luteolibacter arcticus]|uniref:Uncharacterized protein n=1 Tax=Luteolibacter arcticus TaxID=1581411 RepID=A0ABT3GPE9_9BACT|nr:hypothetical protein [Luteolibacter arcticus]MCW1925396.1 hypothetical protein [Luteolibacter arcticus]